jgi:hypothetical protein
LVTGSRGRNWKYRREIGDELPPPGDERPLLLVQPTAAVRAGDHRVVLRETRPGDAEALRTRLERA